MRSVKRLDSQGRGRESAGAGHEILFAELRLLLRIRIIVILGRGSLDIAIALRCEPQPASRDAAMSGKLVHRTEAGRTRDIDSDETAVLIIADSADGYDLLSDLDIVSFLYLLEFHNIAVLGASSGT